MIKAALTIAFFLLVLFLSSLETPSPANAKEAYLLIGFAVHNAANRSLLMQARSEAGGKWEDFTLAAQEIREFPCTYKSVRVGTNTDSGTREKIYDMDCAKRYVLKWNESDSCWDFFRSDD